MPIAIPSELLDLRETLRDFIEREVRPVEDSHRQEIQETGTFEAYRDERMKMRRRSAELGFYGLHMPEEVGGGGLSYLGQVLLHEECGRTGMLMAISNRSCRSSPGRRRSTWIAPRSSGRSTCSR